MFIAKELASSLNISSYMFVMIAMKKENMTDERYITETYDGGIRITMKVYKEWITENGEAQVFFEV